MGQILKETIRLFQDKENHKTTIVVYNMTNKTRQKLINDLFGDLLPDEDVIQDVSGILEQTETIQKNEDSIDGMEAIKVTGSEMESIKKNPVLAAKNAISSMNEMRMSEEHAKDIIKIALDEISNKTCEGEDIDKAVKDIQNVIYIIRNLPILTKSLHNYIAQKGCGGNMESQGQEYATGLINAIRNSDINDLETVLSKIKSILAD